MSRVREAGVPRTGPTVPAAWVRPLLPTVLLLVAAACAWLALQALGPSWLAATALVLGLIAAAAAGALGALWLGQQRLARQSQAARDAQARLEQLSQMLDAWFWQTDEEHRLVRFQPPAGAPADSWTLRALDGDPLWHRLDDDRASLRPRMQAHADLPGLTVGTLPFGAEGADAASPAAGEERVPAGPQRWALQGRPSFDAQGRFTGYMGLAQPLDERLAAAGRQAALDALSRSGPVAAAHLIRDGARPDATGAASRPPSSWRMAACSPAMARLLGLETPPDHPLGWADAVQAAPDDLRHLLDAALAAGGATAANAANGATGATSAPLAPRAEAADAVQRATPSGADSGTEDTQAPRPLVRLLPLDGPSQAKHGTAHSGHACREALLLVAPPANAGDSASQAIAAEHEAFTYTISHDLRAPIRVVEGFGRILKEDYGGQLDRIGRDHLDRVISAAARMNQMIDAMLSLSKLSTQPLTRQPVDLSRLAGFVIDELRRQSPDRQVSVHIAPGLQARGDPTLLRMALENLLGNAWKYSARASAAQIRFETTQRDGRTVYCVSDNGAGFDMRFADRLFGVFQRLHSASDFAGTGVGLASVRRIIRRHGGEIWAESEVGQGARFYFTLKG